MKKQIFTLLLLCSRLFVSYAQIVDPHPVPQGIPEWPYHARVMSQRVIAYQLDQYDSLAQTWNPRDSFTFTYSGTRGTPEIYNAEYDQRVYIDFVTGGPWFENRILNTYDANNNKLMEIGEGYVANQWKRVDSTVYNYNNNHQLQERLYYEKQGNNWFSVFKTTYSYNADGTMHDQLLFAWQNNAWEPDTRYQWFYNTSGQTEQFYIQQWAGNLWFDFLGTHYGYDGQGNPTTYVHFYNDGFGMDTSSRDTRTFNANGQIIEWINETYDANTETWALNTRKLYTYDPVTGGLLIQLNEKRVNNFWESEYRYLFTVNSNGNPVTQNTFKFNPLTINWKDLYRYRYYYEDFENGMSSIANLSDKIHAIVYPNPAGNEVHVMFESNSVNEGFITLTDGMGKVIKAEPVGITTGINNVHMDIGHLAKGMYYIKIHGNNSLGTGSFVKH